MSTHPSAWTLHRLHAGERNFAGADEAREHAASCVACRTALQAHVAQQEQFEASVPFARFEAGVLERAAPKQRVAVPIGRRLAPLAAMAAVLLVGVAVVPQLMREPTHGNRIKGGDAVSELRIAGAGGAQQRVATPGEPEALAAGERVRLGYAALQGEYVLAVSVDAAGVVSALYPETGESLPAQVGAGLQYLPDSLEFTGTGLERVVLVRSRRPLTVESVRAAAERAFERAGRNVSSMGALDVPGEQTQWLLVKP
ncbi:DUF4384 domain-containing protein [Aggregicoccus sp. 17bor-14]|uniref:DUF4384 domain-containing protein n=1 Tax=Myxococcaceae TaxID=31 RepID=UPI00129C4CE0|nr:MULTISPECIES: DUF4384 domain-containing protein [Myxococcaceae]MBF5042517.1 DUF4384 domain-containing protein [Simulacricoccus sp. 17bor-14]MRI88287.1 DUF4384 domain-containing protein [Aggregicoccus sp. 17bor-14]